MVISVNVICRLITKYYSNTNKHLVYYIKQKYNINSENRNKIIFINNKKESHMKTTSILFTDQEKLDILILKNNKRTSNYVNDVDMSPAKKMYINKQTFYRTHDNSITSFLSSPKILNKF